MKQILTCNVARIFLKIIIQKPKVRRKNYNNKTRHPTSYLTQWFSENSTTNATKVISARRRVCRCVSERRLSLDSRCRPTFTCGGLSIGCCANWVSLLYCALGASWVSVWSVLWPLDRCVHQFLAHCSISALVCCLSRIRSCSPVGYHHRVIILNHHPLLSGEYPSVLYIQLNPTFSTYY